MALNLNAKEVISAYLEQDMKAALPDEQFQFERHGYFVADRVDSVAGKAVFSFVLGAQENGNLNGSHFYPSSLRQQDKVAFHKK